jgi:hypothetical protein
MAAKPLPILGRIDLKPPTTESFKGSINIINIKSKRNPIDAARVSGDKDKTVVAIAEYCKRLYPNAPYLMGVNGRNHVLVEAVVMKYLRSQLDWEPTEELPALKPISGDELISHWVALTAKTTHIDLCRAHNTYRKHHTLASELIPADAEGFDSLEWAQGLQWGGAESSSDVRYSPDCELGNSKLAVFHKVKPNDWHKITRQLDATHPFPESCRAWSYCIAVKGKQVPLEPLNNPLRASSASKPYSQGRQYRVWPAEALAIVGQALSRLTAEERGRIRKGWEDATYCSDLQKLLKRLEKLSTPRVQAGYTWPHKQFRRIVDDAGGLMNLWDEYAGWNYNPFLLHELSYSPSYAIPVVEVSEPVYNDFNLFFPYIGNMPEAKHHKRQQQVASMYRCSENGCSCKPTRKYPEVTPEYYGPTPQDDRERWLVAVGHQADWKRPEYLGRK